MKKNLSKLALGVLLAASLGSAQAGYLYVGSWHVGDGPAWTTNPAVYTGQQAAALLFGGNASDYAISTISSNVADINFMSFLDGWGDDQYLTTAKPQNWSLDLGLPGYDAPGGGGTAYSAYIHDHSCYNRYSDMNQVCDAQEPGLNYAFRITGNDVPEPGSLALLGIAGVALGAMRRRKPSTR